MRLKYRYFDRAPIVETTSGSYAAPAAPVTTTQHYWLHPLADILGALLGAGLSITAFDEYPLLRWPGLPWMTRRDEYFWELPPEYGEIPLMFSVTATR
jgi:hypothetical protein